MCSLTNESVLACIIVQMPVTGPLAIKKPIATKICHKSVNGLSLTDFVAICKIYYFFILLTSFKHEIPMVVSYNDKPTFYEPTEMKISEEKILKKTRLRLSTNC